MYEFLRQPRWVLLATLVGVIALLFMNLGFWQLGRLEDRRLDNSIQVERRAAEPVDLQLAVALDDQPEVAGPAHEGRPLTASGTYDPAEEVLLRSRTYQGEAGFHVITPLRLDDNSAVLVNRGWIPLTLGEVPLVGTGASPSGVVQVTGYATASSSRPRFGPTDLPGDLDVFARADVDRIAQQVPYDLYPVVLVAQSETEVPIPVEPDPLDEGPHLAYAIQWFAFAAISIVGYGALIRSTARRARARLTRGQRPEGAEPASV